MQLPARCHNSRSQRRRWRMSAVVHLLCIKFETDGSHRLRMSTVVCLLCLGLGTSGCGNVLYEFRANDARSKLEEAREMGAEQRAPYEYYFAKEHLDKAKSEASEADYGDAYDLAKVALEYANRAVTLSKQRAAAPAPTSSAKPTTQIPAVQESSP